LVTKEIAESRGYDLLHALVDSLYVWKEGATHEDYERLTRDIEEKTRLPLAIESVYRCAVFLPSKQCQVNMPIVSKAGIGMLPKSAPLFNADRRLESRSRSAITLSSKCRVAVAGREPCP
jgi:hypothetical protein